MLEDGLICMVVERSFVVEERGQELPVGGRKARVRWDRQKMGGKRHGLQEIKYS